MSNKIGVIQPSAFPEGMSASNSNIGLTQLPPGYTKISGNSPVASAGVAMIAGVPGQFQESVKLSNNWLKDPRVTVPK